MGDSARRDAAPPPRPRISAYVASASLHRSHSPYALIAAVHVCVVRGAPLLNTSPPSRPTAPARRDEELRVQLRVGKRTRGDGGLAGTPLRHPRGSPRAVLGRPFTSRAFFRTRAALSAFALRAVSSSCFALVTASTALSMRSAFANCPAMPYAQMSAEATGTSGEKRSARMSSTSAHAALAPTLPPLAPARISAESCARWGDAANALAVHRERLAPPVIVGGAERLDVRGVVNAVGATRDVRRRRFRRRRASRRRRRAPWRGRRGGRRRRTVVATCALGGAGAEAATPGSSSPESSAPSGFGRRRGATSTSSSSRRRLRRRGRRSSSHAMGAPLPRTGRGRCRRRGASSGPRRGAGTSLSSRERKPRYEVADGALAASEMVTSPRTARADTSRSRGAARRARRARRRPGRGTRASRARRPTPRARTPGRRVAIARSAAPPAALPGAGAVATARAKRTSTGVALAVRRPSPPPAPSIAPTRTQTPGRRPRGGHRARNAAASRGLADVRLRSVVSRAARAESSWLAGDGIRLCWRRQRRRAARRCRATNRARGVEKRTRPRTRAPRLEIARPTAIGWNSPPRNSRRNRPAFGALVGIREKPRGRAGHHPRARRERARTERPRPACPPSP